jgi:acetylornithine deacetylase
MIGPQKEQDMSSDIRQQVLAQVDADADKAVKFLQQMVAIPSVTGDEARIQRFLADTMGKMGLLLDQWETNWEELKKHPGYRPVDRGYEGRPNIVATWRGTGEGRTLLLNGHSDVIPVGNGEGWSDNPWSGAIRDGRLYGRGSADMKSGVASHVMAVSSLMALGLRPQGDVYINVVVDEEISGHGTLDTVIRGYQADGGISGETSDLAIQPACIGRIWFEIEINGKPAGIQRRYQGISGIELGYRITQAVAALEAERVAAVKHPLYPRAIDAIPCAIGSFQAGNFPSAFPATCLLKGSIATVPGEDHEGVKQRLVEWIARAAAEDPWMRLHPPKVRFVGYDAQASEIPQDHPIVTTVARNYREVAGRDPEMSGRQGAADTRFLNLYGNTPTVIFGPGSTAVMHSDDEYVAIGDYITAIKVMALSICDWCGVQPIS